MVYFVRFFVAWVFEWPDWLLDCVVNLRNISLFILLNGRRLIIRLVPVFHLLFWSTIDVVLTHFGAIELHATASNTFCNLHRSFVWHQEVFLFLAVTTRFFICSVWISQFGFHVVHVDALSSLFLVEIAQRASFRVVVACLRVCNMHQQVKEFKDSQFHH